MFYPTPEEILSLWRSDSPKAVLAHWFIAFAVACRAVRLGDAS